MSKSWRSSNASGSPDASCRIVWRPSRLLTLAIWMLAGLAPFSVLVSGLPRALAVPLALGSAVWTMRAARRYARQAALSFVLPSGVATPTCNGTPMHAPRVHRRGPLARLDWRDPGGARGRCLWWPDSLPAPSRRELRLAMMQRDRAPGQGSVAG
jgi:toxin CptA